MSRHTDIFHRKEKDDFSFSRSGTRVSTWDKGLTNYSDFLRGSGPSTVEDVMSLAGSMISVMDKNSKHNQFSTGSSTYNRAIQVPLSLLKNEAGKFEPTAERSDIFYGGLLHNTAAKAQMSLSEYERYKTDKKNAGTGDLTSLMKTLIADEMIHKKVSVSHPGYSKFIQKNKKHEFYREEGIFEAKNPREEVIDYVTRLIRYPQDIAEEKHDKFSKLKTRVEKVFNKLGGIPSSEKDKDFASKAITTELINYIIEEETPPLPPMPPGKSDKETDEKEDSPDCEGKGEGEKDDSGEEKPEEKPEEGSEPERTSGDTGPEEPSGESGSGASESPYEKEDATEKKRREKEEREEKKKEITKSLEDYVKETVDKKVDSTMEDTAESVDAPLLETLKAAVNDEKLEIGPDAEELQREAIIYHKPDGGDYAKRQYEKSLKSVNTTKANVLARLLARKSKNFEFNVNSMRSGRLDTNKLVEAKQKVPTIYTQMGKCTTNKLTVGVLVDESGSMSGGDIDSARIAAIFINESFKNLRDVELFIYGHTADLSRVGSRNSTDIYIYREPGTSTDPYNLGGIRARSQNRDGVAILYTAKRMRKFTQNQGILLVMSDGNPCCSGHGDSIEETRVKVLEAEALGFQVIQIAISNSVSSSRMFKHYLPMTDPKTLAADMVNYLSNKIDKFIKVKYSI